MTRAVVESHLEQLFRVPSALEGVLPRWEQEMARIATALKDAETFLFLGRGIHYPIAREGALKLKESAYIQAEGYPTGELKHGPNALVNRRTPLVVLGTCDPSAPDSVLRYEKTVNLVRDMHKQGAQILSIVTEGDTRITELSDHVITVPATAEYISPLFEVVPLQLLAYFMAIGRGIDVDNPRNLVKAVVQE
jgi:glucosamine--fructose-6-phosphate aminotransferase (isomerizing)